MAWISDSSDDYLNPLLRDTEPLQGGSRQYPTSFSNFNFSSFQTPQNQVSINPNLQYSATVDNYRPPYQNIQGGGGGYSAATPFQGSINDERSKVFGTCYTPQECDQRGGEQVKHCAAGFGSCCVCKYYTARIWSVQILRLLCMILVRNSCNGEVDQKVSYFTNPSYPLPDRSPNYCTYTIKVQDADICQVRIDFLTFRFVVLALS